MSFKYKTLLFYIKNIITLQNSITEAKNFHISALPQADFFKALAKTVFLEKISAK